MSKPSTLAGGRAQSAMTLLELMAALVILGILVAISRPAVDGISAHWRLRSAAIRVESAVRFAMNAAAARNESVQVMYDVPGGSHWVRVGEDDLNFHRLPSGISMDRVDLGDVEVTADVAACAVQPEGTLDAHEVVLRGQGGERIRIFFDRLTGEAYYEEDADAGS